MSLGRGGRLGWLGAVVALLTVLACGGAEDPASRATPQRTASATATVALANPLTPALFPTFSFVSDDHLAATATATGCPITPYVRQKLTDGTEMLRYETQGLRLYMDADDEGRWFVGLMGFHWESDTTVETTMLLSATAREDGTLVHGQSDWFGTEGYASIDFPRTGCWDVTAEVGERTIDFTVWVIPPTDRPLVRDQLDAREALRPWPVPAGCPATPLIGPVVSTSPRTYGHITYRVDGEQFRLAGDLDLLFEGENALRWYPDTWVEPLIDGTQLDGGLTVFVTSFIRSVDEAGEHAATTLLFPAPGCWQLRGVAGEQAVEATVYVYPVACRPPDEHGTAVTGVCEQP